MHALLNIALRAARDGAAALTANFDRLDRVKVLESGDTAVVTSAHLDAENAMLQQLQKTYPQHNYHSPVSTLPTPMRANTTWYLEPLIGSGNYLRGAHGFLVGVSCQVDNQLKVALFIDPLLNEEYSAVRGNGASLNGRRIRVSNRAALPDSLAAIDFATATGHYSPVKATQGLLDTGAGIRTSGNGALDLLSTAAGRLDGGIITNPTASLRNAAALVLREAGGLVSDISGNPSLEGSHLVFGNPKYFKQLLQLARRPD